MSTTWLPEEQESIAHLRETLSDLMAVLAKDEQSENQACLLEYIRNLESRICERG
jgi:hypothetical protein